MSKDNNLDKYFKMSKLEVKDLSIDKVLEMVSKIQKVDTSGIECYEKHWIKHKFREDKVEIDNNAQSFGNKNGDFFEITAVIKN